MKRTLLPVLLTAVCPLVAGAADYGFTDNIQEANILHCFDWKFSDIENELPRIAEAGFGAVQVSPVQGNCASNAEWYYAYMPYDFKFRANGSGTSAALAQLCDEAAKYGIKIIVDVVANHINGAKSNRDSWWNTEGRLRNEGYVDYNNRYSITHGNLGDYEDIVSEDAEVQARAVEFVEELKGYGVKGIRWDAAKHIGLPSEDCAFWSQVCDVEGMWHYGEILDNPGSNSDTKWTVLQEYTEYMSVTDNSVANLALTLFSRGAIPAKVANHSASTGGHGVAADRIIYWGESHDTYANDGGATKNVDQDVIDRIYCFFGCREKEAALYFSRPSATERTKIKMGVKGSTAMLDNPVIKAFNRFRVLMNGKAEKINFKSGLEGHALFARENGGFALVMPAPGEYDIALDNPDGAVPAGTYADEISGNTFTVTSSTISGHVGPTGYAVVYAGVASVESPAYDASQSEPVYYNLQGMRVENPTQGIYIKVTGTKTERCLIR